MVAELYGTCNGQGMRLNRISEEGNESKWQISIPNTTSNYFLELWAVDNAGNKAYYATSKVRLDGIVTVLKITSVKFTPNPVRINAACEIEVVIEQEHYQYIPYAAFEFDFSNESLSEDLLDMAEYVLEPAPNVPDTELQYVRYRISESEFVNLTYFPASNSWKGLFRAPAVSSWYEEEHKYSVVVEAYDEEGNGARLDRYDEGLGSDLQLRVLDDTSPTVNISSPTPYAYITTAYPWLIFDMFDASPGIDFESLVLLVDGIIIPSKTEVKEKPEDEGWYSIVLTSLQSIKNGVHSIQIRVSDFDGNLTTTPAITITLDTNAGNGEIFNIDPMTFEWYRFKKYVLSRQEPWTSFDTEWLFRWMKTNPEEGDHFFTRTDHHDDDETIYKLQVEVKR